MKHIYFQEHQEGLLASTPHPKVASTCLLGRSPGEGNGNPLQYSCLENPMDRGAWWATVHGVAKSWTLLSDFTHTHLSVDMPKIFIILK